jgi:hypothetical protein
MKVKIREVPFAILFLLMVVAIVLTIIYAPGEIAGPFSKSLIWAGVVIFVLGELKPLQKPPRAYAIPVEDVRFLGILVIVLAISSAVPKSPDLLLLASGILCVRFGIWAIVRMLLYYAATKIDLMYDRLSVPVTQGGGGGQDSPKTLKRKAYTAYILAVPLASLLFYWPLGHLLYKKKILSVYIAAGDLWKGDSDLGAWADVKRFLVKKKRFVPKEYLDAAIAALFHAPLLF